ncbi:hypothetical protein BDD12DRAFT_189876 [Trichophaea hybrida]|nr:hypothetical protein BDD12DRAFT_189876 [Trichophaea hybrida]
MSNTEGVELLLGEPENYDISSREIASKLVEEFDGLPLGLSILGPYYRCRQTTNRLRLLDNHTLSIERLFNFLSSVYQTMLSASYIVYPFLEQHIFQKLSFLST